jgi:hypothetical protein
LGQNSLLPWYPPEKKAVFYDQKIENILLGKDWKNDPASLKRMFFNENNIKQRAKSEAVKNPSCSQALPPAPRQVIFLLLFVLFK